MTSYIIKRILLMIPTLLFVLLVSFVVLNAVPGSPASTQMGSQGTESSSSQSSQESYRIFKEQFNLDKPVLFNLRFNLTQEAVLEHLRVRAAAQRPTCPAEGSDAPRPDNCLAADKQPDSGAIIGAKEMLTDWDDYIVPQLFQVAKTHENLAIRRLAARQLSVNAQSTMVTQYGGSLTDAQREHNDRISAMNKKLEKWKVSRDVSESKLDQVLTENWKPWIEQNRDRFEYTTTEKVGIFFADTRFAKYMANLATLDFGISHVDKQPVIETIGTKVRYTIAMTFSAMLLAFLISVPIGVWSANNQHTFADQMMTTVLLMAFSLPTFLTGLLLLKFFATGDPFDWFPVSGYVGNNPARMTTLTYLKSVGWHLILPVFCLTYRRFAALSRYARSGIVDVIRSDYIRTARAKGLSESMVIIKHAVRNGMIPILTLLGTQLPRLIGGSIVIEIVFGIPGMGDYLLNSIFARDYNALMAMLLISALLTMIGILISDICYAIVDPRISFD
jgi:peptide/nickel transport system permease protein